MNSSTDILQGTLDLLILKTVALEPMHGWGIAQRIQQVSRDMLQIQQGSLYPALYRLERKKWISAEWGASENNRRAKYYSLTKAGREQLEKELADWNRLSSAVALILQRAQAASDDRCPSCFHSGKNPSQDCWAVALHLLISPRTMVWFLFLIPRERRRRTDCGPSRSRA